LSDLSVCDNGAKDVLYVGAGMWKPANIDLTATLKPWTAIMETELMREQIEIYTVGFAHLFWRQQSNHEKGKDSNSRAV
jgi:hypothetical protein